MLSAATIGDVTSDGGEIVSGSCDVFINNIPASKLGSGASSTLVGKTALKTGSGTVFINNCPATRCSDVTACGSVIVTGSSDVFIGD
jgi:uncharacterized Zn-binding protein involved in type VI secretion